MYVFLARIISGVPPLGTRIKITHIFVFLLLSENAFHCFSLCNLQEKISTQFYTFKLHDKTELSKHSQQQQKFSIVHGCLNLAILDVFNVRTSGLKLIRTCHGPTCTQCKTSDHSHHQPLYPHRTTPYICTY